ncbi:MAG: hypothetical protein AB7J40_06160 [Candidatus Altimarinota bacterium]
MRNRKRRHQNNNASQIDKHQQQRQEKQDVIDPFEDMLNTQDDESGKGGPKSISRRKVAKFKKLLYLLLLLKGSILGMLIDELTSSFTLQIRIILQDF